jgi:hypothetical protein
MFPIFQYSVDHDFEIKFNNEVTVSIDWEHYIDSVTEPRTVRATAFHPKAGPLQVTSFEKRYTDDEHIVFGLKPDELLKFMNKSSSMRFTEDGEQCIAFFDF